MKEATVFVTNKTQAVRLPADVRFHDGVKKVLVRIVGDERVLTPINKRWDSFFLNDELNVSDDFMQEREIAFQPERESF